MKTYKATRTFRRYMLSVGLLIPKDAIAIYTNWPVPKRFKPLG